MQDIHSTTLERRTPGIPELEATRETLPEKDWLHPIHTSTNRFLQHMP